ncbi:N-acetylmuramidase domain-containing protein [Falsirhodobacter sp. 20TX0035]|uniref:N-acetylmuramidase domain-containing protein n=1 Tax=Falsirhodobacter sp. 20TX0035 TaxID=3022019 RepID=UPI00232E521E|nr:N-acetylmuramidase domain-containing protein [Falsirhodobacter sp. 20TX0035]MDB6453676.1 N-acetylmuramidase domain-containing protein [Falsirhodobacter sp. 20TX0035]
MTYCFKGRAERLTGYDLPEIATLIGVGEEELRAVMAVEAAEGGFDAQGRPVMVFEPHVFWRELPASKRKGAERAGLACPVWGMKAQPQDSYAALDLAMTLDPVAALRSAAWGLGRILGAHHKAAGHDTVQAMVAAFMDDEAAQLEAMVRFIQSEGLDDDLRRHDWSAFARGYHGAGYATQGVHTKLAAAYAGAVAA